MSTVDKISRGRTGLLLLNGLAFAAWQIMEIRHLEGVLPGGAISILGRSAVIFWICTLVWLLVPVISRQKVIFEDELTRQNRLVAFGWGYWVAIASAVIALFVASNTAAEAIDLLRLILIVGVAAPIIRFATMERSAPDGE